MTSFMHVLNANRLLTELPAVERDGFMAVCETVELSFGEVLFQPAETITHVYFPIDSFISLIVVLDSDNRLEVAMAGREGMLGSSLVLGIEETPMLALVQGAGSALRITAENFGYTDLMVDGAPSPHQSDTTLRWLIDRLRS